MPRTIIATAATILVAAFLAYITTQATSDTQAIMQPQTIAIRRPRAEHAEDKTTKDSTMQPSYPLTLDFLARSILFLEGRANERAPRLTIGDTSVGNGDIIATIKRLLIKYKETDPFKSAEEMRDNTHLVGVEPDLKLARIARSQDVKVLTETLENTRIKHEELDFVICNLTSETKESNSDSELSRLMITLQFLKKNGLFLLIVRRATLDKLATAIATHGWDVKISNFAPGEAKNDEVIVWFRKKRHLSQVAPDRTQKTAEWLTDFANGKANFEEDDYRYQLYTTSQEIDFINKMRLHSETVSINKHTGREPEPFHFQKKSEHPYADIARHAYSKEGIVGIQRDKRQSEAFKKGRTQQHRGIRADQRIIILGSGIGNYLPARFMDPRDESMFNGILRITSCDEEKTVEQDKELGVEKARKVQSIVSSIYNADNNTFIELANGQSDQNSINQRDFLTNAHNSQAIQELTSEYLLRTFEPPSLEEIAENTAPNPLRFLSDNFKIRLMPMQHNAAMNAASLIQENSPAFLIAEQGTGKSKTYQGIMELANKRAPLMILPEQLTEVLAKELAETLYRVTTVSLDAITLNTLKMPEEMPLPFEWEEALQERYGAEGIQTYWEDEAAGTLMVDFTQARNEQAEATQAEDTQAEAAPTAIEFEAFAEDRLGSPYVDVVAESIYRVTHDICPVSDANLRAIIKQMPKGTTGFIEHTESMRFVVPWGAGRAVRNQAARVVRGAKATRITDTEFRITRSRPVSRDPVIYQLEASKRYAKQAGTSPQNPVYTLIPFTMLTRNHTKVSSLQTWRVWDRETTDDEGNIVPNMLPPLLVENSSLRPLPLQRHESPEAKEIYEEEMQDYIASMKSRMALSCPECLTPLRTRKRRVTMLERPGGNERNPMLDGAAVANVLDADGIVETSAKFNDYMQSVAVTRAQNQCKICGTALGASYHQQIARGKDRTDIQPNNALAAIEYILSTAMKGVYDAVIFDESHKTKGMNSARGIAAGKLMDKIKSKVLGTATFSNGFASSQFRAFRTIPTFREEYGINDQMRFQDDYGFMEITRTLHSDKDDQNPKQKRRSDRPKQIPGLKGQFIQWLLPHMVSMKLHDVAEMCNLNEYLVSLDIEEEMFNAYRDLLSQLNSVFVSAVQHGDGTTVARVLSDIRNLGITYLNAPYRGIRKFYPQMGVEERFGEAMPDPEELTVEEREELFYEPVIVPAMYQNELTVKERKLLELFESTLEADPDAKFMAFVHYTGKLNYVEGDGENNLISRLRRLGGADIDMRYLGDQVATASRTAHIEDMVRNGAQVVFVNPKRVAEGVTLNMMTNIIFFETPTEPTTKSQASRRSYRLNQTKDINVYTMYYAESIQEFEMALIQNKEASDRIVSGEMPAVDEKGRDVVNLEDALLDMVRHQVINGQAALPEEMRVQQPDDDTSQLLTQRSTFVGEEEYTRRMTGITLEEWVGAEAQHLSKTVDNIHDRHSWLGFTPPISVVTIEPTMPDIKGLPELLEELSDVLPDTPQQQQNEEFNFVTFEPEPHPLKDMNNWFDNFKDVPYSASDDESEDATDVQAADKAIANDGDAGDGDANGEVVQLGLLAGAWADAFFDGDAEDMTAQTVTPKRKKRTSKEEQIAKDKAMLANWKALSE